MLLLLAAVAGAEPLDLGERRARPVRVAFETSPSDRPARLDHQYTELVPAWFEPGPGPGRATVRVSGADFERVVAASDPVPGSFGDFVWIFDVASGHVLSATVAGAFFQHLSWGFLETRVKADVVARMTTLHASGLLPPHERFGLQVFRHCGVDDPDCRLVEPRPYDRISGYVNAVGSIRAHAMGGITTETFSPLGEAIFTEMSADGSVSAR